MNPLYITMPITFLIILFIIYRFGAYWGKRFQENTIFKENFHLPEKTQKFVNRIIEHTTFITGWWNSKKDRVTKISIELGLITIWAIIITMPYLDFNENLIPAGNEFSSGIQTHHIWSRFQECGWCAVWNSSVHGGYPAFVDIHGSALHPIVIFTTVIFGVINGAKISLLIAFWSAGIAQWWFAKELKVSRLACVWTACMAVAGGQLSSRMELGAFGVVLSTAMISLVFAALIAVARRGTKRTIVLLAITLALAILSGQGYMQVGLVFMSPAILFLLWDDKFKPQVLKNYILAAALALLLAAPFLIPFLHFSPQIVKETDLNFNAAQPVAFLPLNLVIDDPYYYRSEILHKLSFPSLNGHYIGWIPVLLAFIGLARFKRENRQYVLFMASGIFLIFLAASAISLKWVSYIYPAIAGVRHTPQICGLAIPLLLGLSAIGLDAIQNIKWPSIWFSNNQEIPKNNFHISMQWILIIPLLFSLKSVYNFGTNWIFMVEKYSGIYEIVDALGTPSLEWVNTPFGEHVFIEPAISAGLKLSSSYMTWRWRDREDPIASIEANRAGPPYDTSYITHIVDGIPIYKLDNQAYAEIKSRDRTYPCSASGTGGQITVECTTPEDGILTIEENMWSGWNAWQDDKWITLSHNRFLEVKAAAGKHTYQFLYLPWDVPLGLIFSFIGIFICFKMWFANSKD